MRWTETEDYILAENWPKGGYQVCANLLPRRSEGAIRTRAQEKSLRVTDIELKNHRNRWTAEEVQFLRDNYPTKGIEYCTAAMPNRTPASVRIKIGVLGLTLTSETIRKIIKNASPRKIDDVPIEINETAIKALSMRW